MRLGKRNGAQKRGQSKFPLTASAAVSKAAHPAVAKLAVALREFKELAEQHAATAEILRVIANSTENAQAVFDAITRAGARLVPDSRVALLLAKDGQLHLKSYAGLAAQQRTELAKFYPRAVDASTVAGAAVLKKALVHVPDLKKVARQYPLSARMHANTGSRAMLAVPLMSRGRALGTVVVTRIQPGAFSRRQIALVRTFADQAVIAIENARLFNETKEALEHQKASADILRIVASSVESTDPVFKAITEAGMRLVPGCRVALHLLRDGQLQYVSHSGVPADHLKKVAKFYPISVPGAVPSAIAVAQKRVVHIPDIEKAGKDFALGRRIARVSGWRSILSVPLMRGKEAIGNIAITRAEPGPFTDKQIALLQTFADQAVIAIENARLFNETKEALERQTATSEILRVISSSPADLHPVFVTISRRFTSLCGAEFSTVFTYDGELVHYAGGAGFTPERERRHRAKYPVRVDDPSVISARTVFSRAVVHVQDVLSDPHYDVKRAEALGVRRILGVPLLRDGVPLGAMVAGWAEPGATPKHHEEVLKTFADQAVIAIENVRLFNETKEALEQQTAIGEVLRVISDSPTDVKPVLDAVAARAAKICEASDARIWLVEGDRIRHAAGFGDVPMPVALGASLPLERGVVPGRAILDRAPVHVEDMAGQSREDYPVSREMQERSGFRTILAVPLMREQRALGAIMLRRMEVRSFSDKQIALLKTFADQAAIAIENVRLFNETKEALEQQTATSEILGVISRSPTDLSPVFDAILKSALELCDAHLGHLNLYDGENSRTVAHRGANAEFGKYLSERGPFKPGPNLARMAAERRPVHVPDLREAAGYLERKPEAVKLVEVGGARTSLYVPLLTEHKVLGSIVIYRPEVRAFTEKQVALVSLFANQAVIAIENTRLFNETKEALERQTATAEILRVISQSQTDTQPVFDTIVRSAVRLCAGSFGSMVRIDGDTMHLEAFYNPSPEAGKLIALRFPAPLSEHSLVALAARTGEVVHSPDTYSDPRSAKHPVPTALGVRAQLTVPLLREGKAVALLNVVRDKPGAFSEAQIEVLKTFADQAVIAIENVRLFNETKEALEQQTATSEILGVISASPTDLAPVFDAILRRGLQLCEAHLGHLHLFDGEFYRTVAQRGAAPEFAKYIAERGPYKPEGAVLRAVPSAEPVHIPDLQQTPAYLARKPNTVKFVELGGARTCLSVPLLKERKVLGVLVIYRSEVRPFSEKQIALISLFASQAVIAIDNARLFNETKEALERQTATAEILKVIASSPSDVQPVFDAIVGSALRLMSGTTAHVTRLEADKLHLVAYSKTDAAGTEALKRLYPMAIAGTIADVAMAARTALVVADAENDERISENMRAVIRARGVRSFVIMPMVLKGAAIGTIVVNRRQGTGFSNHEIELLRTFADQAVIAIENVRLFNETKEALEQQTGTTEILKVISQSPTDTKPVFEIIAERAVKLCDAAISVVARFDGKSIHLVASHGVNPKATEMMGSIFPMRPEDETVMARTVRNRAIVHVADVLADATYSAKDVAAAADYRSSLGIPMMRAGEVIGGIFVARAKRGLFSDKQLALLQTFADQAVIAIENVRLFNETKEALDRQTATAEILKVIASSPADVQPVFEAIVRSGRRLFPTATIAVLVPEGGKIVLRAMAGADPDRVEKWRRAWPVPLAREYVTGAAILECKVVDIPDFRDAPDQFAVGARHATAFGYVAATVMPMVRVGAAIGAISVLRVTPGPLGERELSVLRTFADQAVIAIENVRLFNETKEALEQQTATAEILKVISSSTTDTQPVFEAIVQSAARLFAPCMVAVVMREGDVLLRKARAGPQPPRADQGAVATIYPLPFDAERSMAARSVIERRIIQVPDTEAEGLPPIVKSLGRAAGYRAITLVPLVKEGEGIGVIGLSRPEPGFKLTDKQLALVRTFADQAVIAIENVRLFKELQDRTEALTKSVGQLTALGQVGQAITSTLDLETVLKTIVSHAVKLTGLDAGAVYEYDEGTEEFHLRAAENLGEEILEVLRTRPIRKGDGVVGRTAVTREPMQIHDTQDESYQSNLRELVIRTGRRALLAVPLMREDHIIGALTVQRNTPGPFAPEVVELLKTFATQSAMAIQNARLYREIEQKSRELETASKHKSQFLASMSHELRTPLNAILGFNEMILDQVYGEVPQDVKAPLENIQSSGKHLLRLINNVLDLAKIEAGRMELALSEYSVQDTVASVHSTLKPLAAEKGLEFVAEAPADIPPAHGDAGRLAQCLMNLAGNSLKFTKEGRVSIAVAQDNGLLRFSVADTGIGIPPEKIAGLFTEFKQTDATIASEYGGTGLGLSITKKFIEMHGGRIWVESKPGKGSTFLFEIPLRAAQ